MPPWAPPWTPPWPSQPRSCRHARDAGDGGLRREALIGAGRHVVLPAAGKLLEAAPVHLEVARRPAAEIEDRMGVVGHVGESGSASWGERVCQFGENSGVAVHIEQK